MAPIHYHLSVPSFSISYKNLHEKLGILRHYPIKIHFHMPANTGSCHLRFATDAQYTRSHRNLSFGHCEGLCKFFSGVSIFPIFIVNVQVGVISKCSSVQKLSHRSHNYKVSLQYVYTCEMTNVLSVQNFYRRSYKCEVSLQYGFSHVF